MQYPFKTFLSKKPGTIFLLLLIITQVSFGQAAKSRYVEGQKLISTQMPGIALKFSDEFIFVDYQSFTLFKNSKVEQFYFVKADGKKRVNALYTVQFESFLPEINQTYNYKINDSLVINGTSFLHSPVYNKTQAILGDTLKSDVWHRFMGLLFKGYQLPAEVIGHRFIKIVDDTKRNEILIIYNEDIKNTGATASELDKDSIKNGQVMSQLLQNALKGFSILQYEPPGPADKKPF